MQVGPKFAKQKTMTAEDTKNDELDTPRYHRIWHLT